MIIGYLSVFARFQSAHQRNLYILYGLTVGKEMGAETGSRFIYPRAARIRCDYE